MPLESLLRKVKLKTTNARNTRALTSVFDGKTANHRTYCCIHCGLALAGKHTKVIDKIFAEVGVAGNNDLNELHASDCVVSDDSKHEWKRPFTSPIGYRLIEGAPAVV